MFCHASAKILVHSKGLADVVHFGKKKMTFFNLTMKKKPIVGCYENRTIPCFLIGRILGSFFVGLSVCTSSHHKEYTTTIGGKKLAIDMFVEYVCDTFWFYVVSVE